MKTNYSLDYNNAVNDNRGYMEYITIYEDNKSPRWYKVTHNKRGAYVIFRGKRLYVLEV